VKKDTDRRVFVYNRTREVFVATEVDVADSYGTRLVGLLGKGARWARPGRGLWIIPSHGVHTIGMLFPIDVIFLDKQHCVIHVEEHMRPFRLSRVLLKAHSVVELPPHTIFRTGTKVGDEMELGPINGYPPSILLSAQGAGPRSVIEEQHIEVSSSQFTTIPAGGSEK
jgi:uncharacterized membrane protein (UPF0127 family)